jgi:hypothetical protein
MDYELTLEKPQIELKFPLLQFCFIEAVDTCRSKQEDTSLWKCQIYCEGQQYATQSRNRTTPIESCLKV